VDRDQSVPLGCHVFGQDLEDQVDSDSIPFSGRIVLPAVAKEKQRPPPEGIPGGRELHRAFLEEFTLALGQVRQKDLPLETDIAEKVYHQVQMLAKSHNRLVDVEELASQETQAKFGRRDIRRVHAQGPQEIFFEMGGNARVGIVQLGVELDQGLVVVFGVLVFCLAVPRFDPV